MDPQNSKQYVLDRINERVEYYWNSSKRNKRAFKGTRYLGVTLGAIVTMGSSVQGLLPDDGNWSLAINIATPVIAAILTVTSGLSQSFHWGAAWREMVMTATRLEDERDRIVLTPEEQLDPAAEMAKINTLVEKETRGFFDRIFVGAASGDHQG